MAKDGLAPSWLGKRDWGSGVAYLVAVIAAAGASVSAALVDLNSALALVPLTIPVIPPVAALLVRSHRAWVVGGAVVFEAAFAFAGGFTIGDWYWPSVSALVVGAAIELTHFSIHDRAASHSA